MRLSVQLRAGLSTPLEAVYFELRTVNAGPATRAAVVAGRVRRCRDRRGASARRGRGAA